MILRSLRPELKKWEDLVTERKEKVENLTLAAISAGEIQESQTEGRFSFVADLRKRINNLMLEQVGIEAKLKRINADWPANRNEIDEALARFTAATEADPRLVITYLGILDQLNLDAQKQRYVLESLKLDQGEEHITILAKACTQYMLREATKDTVDFALTLLSRSPSNLQLLSYLSQLHFEIGDHETAAKYLLQMNELKPNQPLILNNLAMCLSDILGKESLAVQYAEQALALAPLRSIDT
ncbi:MAG: hypothetical protein L7U72_02575 [Rubripirellula sp.]|nr:hypothetical protein [Rubripirellula sp.]